MASQQIFQTGARVRAATQPHNVMTPCKESESRKVVYMFTPQPPPADIQTNRIVRAPQRKPLYFVSRCKTFTGVQTHYWSEKTRLCCGTLTCLACDQGAARRWQGYIFGESTISDCLVVVHLTDFAARQLDAVANGTEKGLYRRVIKLTRSGGRKGKVHAEILESKSCGPMILDEALEARVRTIYKSVGNCRSPELRTA